MSGGVGYIYAVHDDDGRIVYVGQTTRTIAARWRDHTREAEKGPSTPFYAWFHEYIRRTGGVPRVSMLEMCSHDELAAAERKHIQQQKSDLLTNVMYAGPRAISAVAKQRVKPERQRGCFHIDCVSQFYDESTLADAATVVASIVEAMPVEEQLSRIAAKRQCGFGIGEYMYLRKGEAYTARMVCEFLEDSEQVAAKKMLVGATARQVLRELGALDSYNYCELGPGRPHLSRGTSNRLMCVVRQAIDGGADVWPWNVKHVAALTSSDVPAENGLAASLLTKAGHNVFQWDSLSDLLLAESRYFLDTIEDNLVAPPKVNPPTVEAICQEATQHGRSAAWLRAKIDELGASRDAA